MNIFSKPGEVAAVEDVSTPLVVPFSDGVEPAPAYAPSAVQEPQDAVSEPTDETTGTVTTAEGEPAEGTTKSKRTRKPKDESAEPKERKPRTGRPRMVKTIERDEQAYAFLVGRGGQASITELAEGLGINNGLAYSCMVRLGLTNRVVKVARATYQIPGTIAPEVAAPVETADVGASLDVAVG